MTTFDPNTFATDRVTFVTFHDDGSVSAYFGNVWLCNEDSREEAESHVRFILQAHANGANWAHNEFPTLAV